MSKLKIFQNILFVIVGLFGIIAVLAFDMEAYYALLGILLVAWGGYDIYKETRDMKKDSEVDQLSKKREEKV